MKNWEKPIYKAYHFETLKPLLMDQSKTERSHILKRHLLTTSSHQLGPHPICIYLIAFYIQQSSNPSLKDFKYFCIEKGISDQENSASAIWSVGFNDGKYLDVFTNDLEIKNMDFFVQWSKQTINPTV